MTNMSIGQRQPQSMNPQGMPMQPQNAQANNKYTSGVQNVAGPGQQVVFNLEVTPQQQQVMQQQQLPAHDATID